MNFKSFSLLIEKDLESKVSCHCVGCVEEGSSVGSDVKGLSVGFDGKGCIVGCEAEGWGVGFDDNGELTIRM